MRLLADIKESPDAWLARTIEQRSDGLKADIGGDPPSSQGRYAGDELSLPDRSQRALNPPVAPRPSPINHPKSTRTNDCASGIR